MLLKLHYKISFGFSWPFFPSSSTTNQFIKVCWLRNVRLSGKSTLFTILHTDSIQETFMRSHRYRFHLWEKELHNIKELIIRRHLFFWFEVNCVNLYCGQWVTCLAPSFINPLLTDVLYGHQRTRNLATHDISFNDLQWPNWYLLFRLI